jgi:hypothetical protein
MFLPSLLLPIQDGGRRAGDDKRSSWIDAVQSKVGYSGSPSSGSMRYDNANCGLGVVL